MDHSIDPGYGIRPPGFRLPDQTRVGRVRLQVADLGRSIDYYGNILGLGVLARGPDSVELGPSSGRVLVELRERRGVRPAPRRGTLGLFGRGVVSGLADHAVSESAYLTDPDGLGIEVYADRPRTAWRPRPDGQLHITTEPLNVGDVTAAAGEGHWHRAPSGTTMGHIHLHVRDLAGAEAFYHHGVGFDKVAWTYPGALFLSAGGYHHHLGTNTWSSGASAAEDQARLLSWDLETVDPAAVAENLTREGHAVSRRDVGWQVADPSGTVIEIRAFEA